MQARTPRVWTLPGVHRFRINGLKTHGTARVRLRVRSESEMRLDKVAVPLRMKIEDAKGDVIFLKNGPLSAHLERMNREGRPAGLSRTSG